MLNRTVAPEFREIAQAEISQAKTSFLDNGIPLHIIKSGTEPVIRLELIFKAGHWYEPFNGVSYFTTKLLSSGTSGLSAKQIEEQIAQYGAFLDLTTGYDRCTVTIYCLSKYLENVLPIVFKMITQSVFPIEELDNLKKITSQNLKVNLKKTSFLATKNFRALLFGEAHPYGRSIDESALNGINREALVTFYKDRFCSKDCDIVLSGNGSENFHGIVNQILGKHTWGTSDHSEPAFPIEGKTAEKFLLIKSPDSVQSSIRMGCKLFSINHPDYFKLNLLIEIFGGYFSSRLMQNIREEKGYTYGISASFHSLGHSGYMVIGTDVNKENTNNTIDEVRKEMQILKSELISEEELSTASNYLLGSFVNSLSTPFGLADKFKTIYYHKLTYSFYDQYIHSLKNTTPSELLEIANRYFDEEKMLTVVAGDSN